VSLYDEIVACEQPASAGALPLSAACVYLAATNLHYDAPGARLACPAGPEPEPASVVAEIVKRAMPWKAEGQDAADVERYVGERYDRAMADWSLRVEACVGAAAKDTTTTRSSFVGFGAILLGLGLIAASRTK
jgi:hypothetical protein